MVFIHGVCGSNGDVDTDDRFAFEEGKVWAGCDTADFCTGYILLINATHNNPWHHSNYFERMYLVLIPMCMLPFLTEVYSCSPHKRIFEVAFICIILFRGYGIVQHTERYASRIEKVRLFVATAQQQVGSKFL